MKVLFLVHNHPSLHPGGTEIFAQRLKGALERTGEVEVVFAATRTGSRRTDNAGTHFGAIEPNSDSVVISGGRFDRDDLSQADTYGFLEHIERLVDHVRPDVVHFHHFVELGLESLVSATHGWPKARIVMTLHDYYAICSNEGLLVKRQSGGVCRDPSPMACQRCFPDKTIESFRLRELFVRAAFGFVHRFVAPSQFLRQQFIAAGLGQDRIVHIPNGHLQTRMVSDAQGSPKYGVRFAFFGNFQPHKGILVLLAAASHLHRASVPFELHLYGFDGYSSDEVKSAVRRAEQDLPSTVVFHGSYSPGECSELMANVDWIVVPSIWPENNPLVIQEALAAGRPVLCSDVGGIAEHVVPGRVGVHFRMGDAFDLARKMRSIVEGTDTVSMGGIAPSVPDMEECAQQHLGLYRELLGSGTGVAKKRKIGQGRTRRAMA